MLTLTLGVFAAVVAFVTWQTRARLQEQILAHEGAFVANVATMQLANSAAEGNADTPGELLAAVLQTSKLRGVFLIRVFDRERQFEGGLPFWSEAPPAETDWQRLAGGLPVTRLHRRDAHTLPVDFLPVAAASGADIPVLEVWAPLRRAVGARLEGAAQFWMDGADLANEFSALDRRLATQAVLAWGAGALVIASALAWAFRRLAAASRELAARGEDLERANRELVLAAKTSALGAVTAHLIHEIKNPVAGLELFVASQAESAGGAESGAELAAASELTRRLRTMINDVVAVLRDEQHGGHFELSCADVVEIALAKVRSVAERRACRLELGEAHPAVLPGRRANLAALVLQNLLHNAAEASPANAAVRIGSRAAPDRQVEFYVEDQGGGLPPAVRARLFHPCVSSKPGGSGLGLAISQRLAQQAGGRLELLRSDERGTCFRLVLPVE
ncbi:MAG: HAMP domain-containing histidine kinase [Verrucomicrobia bacterium]|nr:HAMP domain-containing histidine kinase [Verrucomicrobiota bacterium]